MTTWHDVLAYGSNMHQGELRRWLRERGHEGATIGKVEPAKLVDHALVFHYFAKARGGGAADVVRAPGSTVFGLVLTVDDAGLRALDSKEGHPAVYEREALEVALLEGGERRRAWVYKVHPAHWSSVPVPPTAAYRQLLIDGARAHGLPHVGELEALECR